MHAPPTRLRTALSTLPVLAFLIGALAFDLSGRINARMMEAGQSFWDGYALLRADPERPATMIAVISTPSSRKAIRPVRLTVSISAPNCSSWIAPCWAMSRRSSCRPD